ncbi:MAG: hypothetical protein DRP56_06695, partial [Planctomycetota bacterium]
MPAPRIRDTDTALALLKLRQDAYKEAVEKLQSDLWEGKLTVDDWKKAMQQEVKDLHISAAVIAKGGEWGAMT